MSRIAALLALIFTLAACLPAGPAEAQPRGCPAAMPAPERLACLEAQASATDAELQTVFAAADATIAGGGVGDLSPDDRREWAEVFGKTRTLWLAFRDATCAPQLLAFERGLAEEAARIAALSCRTAITRTMVQDLSFRFREPQTGAPRASFASAGRSPNRRDVIAAEGEQPLCRHPGRGGDYQPLTACYERHAASVDRELNEVWARVLAAIRARATLSEADRAAWVAALRAAQRPWAELRDTACPAEAFETPNRYAHSIYANLTGPCLIVETEERIRALKSAYRLR